MPRNGVTYDQVAAAADGLVAENVTATNKNVRERLGTGSSGTIQRYLLLWRETQRPQLVSQQTELPQSIGEAISKEIGRATAEARAEIEARLVIVQGEAAELSSVIETLETELDKQRDEIITLTADMDKLNGTLRKQANEIDTLARENERERVCADQARTEVAQLRNKLELKEEKIAEQAAAIKDVTLCNASASQAKIIAEKEAAVSDAKLAAETEKSAMLLTEKTSLVKQVDAERSATESARAETVRVAAELAGQSALVTEMRMNQKALSAAFDAEKLAHAEAEKCVTELSEQLTSERIARESAVAETAILAGELELSSKELAETLSALSNLQGCYDSELQAHCQTRQEVETLRIEAAKVADGIEIQSAF